MQVCPPSHRNLKKRSKLVQNEINAGRVEAPCSPMVGGGDNWALIILSFTHVTTKAWAHSERFGFFRIFLT